MCVAPCSLDPELDLWSFVWSVSVEILHLSNIVNNQSSGRAWHLRRYQQGEINPIVSKVGQPFWCLVCCDGGPQPQRCNIQILETTNIWGRREIYLVRSLMQQMKRGSGIVVLVVVPLCLPELSDVQILDSNWLRGRLISPWTPCHLHEPTLPFDAQKRIFKWRENIFCKCTKAKSKTQYFMNY